MFRNKLAGFAIALVAATFVLPDAALAGKKVLRLHFNGPVLEAPTPDSDLAILFGGKKSRTLREWVKMIEGASRDPEISGMVMIIESPAIGFAQLEEIGQAIEKFKERGRKVHCYMEYAGNGSYALASLADHITLAEYSSLNITGLHAELSYYKGLLDKIGVYADMMHCGDYKSALEPFTRTEPSAEAAANVNWLLDGIYERWIELMAEGRGVSATQMKAFVDRAPIESQAALEAKLVDAVGSFADFRKRIRKEFGKDVELLKKYPPDESMDFELDTSNPFTFFTQMNRMMDKMFGSAEESEKPGVGLIYIDGAIVVGRNEQGPFSSGASAGSTTIRAALDEAAEDDKIRAVVLRVNSPGGSALASDIIWKAARRCAEEKPLIVSMGGVAGSGGYYVSLPGDVIFADASTITGSIGVVGGKMVWHDLFTEKLGITTTEFDRGAHASLMSLNRRWNDDERAWMMDYMTSIYDQFKGRVMESRGDRIEADLESLAGGRVYTGKQALEIGLIDEIGSLSDAIAMAGERIDMKRPDVYVLPREKDFFETLKTIMGEETEDEFEITLGAQLASDPLFGALGAALHQLAPAQMQRVATDLGHLLILNREHVGCFMPMNLSIR